ncbi:MAG: hypothetical protein IKJ05_01270 [Oscillospiraceae bacterium]|nr:hypothetical protein [Oscillospiraceae bacterium]
MKKPFFRMMAVVTVVYRLLFIKIRLDRPDFIYDRKATLAQRDIVITETQIPLQSTDREFYLWQEHFKCRQRQIFQGDIQVLFSASTDESGNTVIDEILDITATGGDDEYKFVTEHSKAYFIEEQGTTVVTLMGQYEKHFTVDRLPLMKYMPGMFAKVKLTQPATWNSETIVFLITIEPQYIQQLKDTGEFTKQIVNTRIYDY